MDYFERRTASKAVICSHLQFNDAISDLFREVSSDEITDDKQNYRKGRKEAMCSFICVDGLRKTTKISVGISDLRVEI